MEDADCTPLIGWGGIHPEKVRSYLYLENEISHQEQERIANLWEKLKGENAPLRASVNGYLMSVREDFYDTFILGLIGKMPFKVSALVLEILHSSPLGISDYIISSRLKAMIKAGLLAVEQREARFYDSILQRE